MITQLTLEDVALGEITSKEGADVVRRALGSRDDRQDFEVYSALRSWLWKTLRSRRSDEELDDWFAVFSYAASELEDSTTKYGVKLEGFMELLRASVAQAVLEENSKPLERKHASAILAHAMACGGRIRRSDLLKALQFKPANLTRVMAPLLDQGFIAREVMGREVDYRLTEKGRVLLAATPDASQDPTTIDKLERSFISGSIPAHIAIVSYGSKHDDGISYQPAQHTRFYQPGNDLPAVKAGKRKGGQFPREAGRQSYAYKISVAPGRELADVG